MTTLLQINSSISSDAGQSSKLAARFVVEWQARHPDGQVRVRDLARDPVPHLTAERFAAFLVPAEQRSAAQQAIVAESDALIEELRSADIVVLGLPMYNFHIPSTLKAYFDHIARAGVSFRYTANGPEGLMGDRRVVIFAARGGVYTGTTLDTQTPYLTTFLGFLGIRSLEFVYTEGLALGAEPAQRAIEESLSRIPALAV